MDTAWVAAEWRAMRLRGGSGGIVGGGAAAAAAAAAAAPATTSATAAASTAATSCATTSSSAKVALPVLNSRFGSVLDLSEASRFVYTSGGAEDDIVYGAKFLQSGKGGGGGGGGDKSEEEEARRAALSRLRQALGEEEWDIAAM